MTKSYDDLMAAFAGESQANRKYLAFAKKADDEGYAQVARLFRAAAHAETVHALTHFRTAGEVKSTEENLKEAVAGEHYENSEMYPAFIKDAEEEGDAKALRSFTWANEVEKIHEMLYREALETLGKPGETYDYYICPVCGYTHARTAPEKCPICGVPASKFEKIS
ncbi:MAG: rubrerythrin [Chloroflexi bacterium HGW-Chloroflexi-5]|jgi:rubrerythrin|nr:MAG: rubrerythrin [Chloroflexi bacterium HGW-Chloroflexi-5]